jgi:hypothetical protein
METNSAKSLPKMLPGVVCEQWNRRGRKNCRCVKGLLHGPYYYRFWREFGRLRKAYVPRDAVADMRARCMARQEEVRSLASARVELGRMLSLLREVEGHE